MTRSKSLTEDPQILVATVQILVTMATWRPFRHTFYKKSEVRKTGRDNSVNIATRYGLEGPGIESPRGRDFSQPSRPALSIIQFPTK